MAIESATLIPASASGQSVIINGRVLRKIRLQVGLRLVDLAGGKGPVARLSRLERRPTQRMAAVFLNYLLHSLGIGPTFTGLDTWHTAIVADAINWYTRGDLRAVRRTMMALGLVVAPYPPKVRLLAEVFEARSAEPEPSLGSAGLMRRLSVRAEREAAWPAAAWAYLFESETHEARGAHEAALAAAMSAIGIPQSEDTALPLLCVGAVATRAFARCGLPADGWVILQGVPIGVSQPFAVAQLARAAAVVHETSGMHARAAACLERAAEAAKSIPNPELGAAIREDLAELYCQMGRPDLACMERLHAAALCRRAGHVDDALALIDAAFGAE